MRTEHFVEIVGKQLVAALDTLKQVIEQSSDEAWAEEHPDGAINRVVFHALYFADLYLNPSPAGLKEQPFHVARPDFFQDYQEERDEEPTNFYPQLGCLEYVDFCREKAVAASGTETEETLAGPSGFSWYACTRAEMYLINIRHVQHHAAQLGLRRQLAGHDALRWVSGLKKRN